MTSVDPARRVAAERWFLDRGLPWVLTPRARWRALWPRSAPALAAYATVEACLLVIFFLTGTIRVVVGSDPTAVEGIVLTLVTVALPLAAVVGWMVARLPTNRERSIASTVAVVVAGVSAGIAGGLGGLLIAAAIVALVLLLTASGVGSVWGWEVRLTLSHLAAAGALLLRALPVVLLTVLVFFNGNVWVMGDIIGRGRLGLALLFLLVIAVAFVVTGTLEQARQVARSMRGHPHDPAGAEPHDAVALAGTPFDGIPDPPDSDPLSRGERANVVFVLATTQIVQILVVAILTAAIFFVLGLILLSPGVLAAWTRNGSPDGILLGMTIPVPQALIHMTLVLAALTFMYVSARAVGDGEYRARFLDPLMGDVRLTLIARNRYRRELISRPDDPKPTRTQSG